MGTSQTSSATDVVLKVQKGLQGMNPEKEISKSTGQTFLARRKYLVLAGTPTNPIATAKTRRNKDGINFGKAFFFSHSTANLWACGAQKAGSLPIVIQISRR